MIKTLVIKDLYARYSALFHPGAALKDKKEKRKLFSLIFSFIIIAFYAVLIQRFLFGQIDSLVQAGMINLFIVSISTSHILFLVFTVLPSIMSNLYFSNDIKIMQTLPIKNMDIIISKSISIFIDSLFVSLFLIIPTFIRLCYFSSYNIIVYLTVLISIFLTNILIISLLSFIIIKLMKYLNRISNLKNIMQALALMAGLVIYILITRYINTADSLMTVVKNFDNSVFRFFPHAFFMVKIFNRSILLSLLYTLVYAGIVFAIMYLVGRFSEKALQKGLELNSITGSRKKKRKKALKIKKRSVVREIANKEFKEILKTPIYFFNIMAIGIIFIIIFSIGFLGAAAKDGVSLSGLFGGLDYNFGENILEEIFSCMLIGFLYTTFVSLNSSTISTITREGNKINVIKTLPTTAKDQVDGRLLASLWISAFNAFFAIIIIIALTIIKSGLTISSLTMPLAFAGGAVISWFYYSNIDLYIGIKYPYFDWDSPQRAVKGGTNPLKSMAFTFANALIIYLLYKFFAALYEDLFTVVQYVSLIYMLLCLIFGGVIYKLNISTLEEKLPKYRDE